MILILLALLVIALFWALILLANRTYDLKRRGLEVAPGLLVWRTKRGLRFIDRVGRTHKRGWRAFGSVAAVVGVVLMVFVFIALVLGAILVLRRPGVAIPGAKLILPGITIPLVEGLIAIFSVLLVHEFAHGFLMRAQGLQTRSTGLLLLLAIPGAFVEPNEKQLKKAPLSKRLRVYGAGSFANILFAVLCLGLILVLITPKSGVYIYGIEENSPADNSGELWLGARLIEIDNATINTYDEYFDSVENIAAGENLSIRTERGLVTITAAENFMDNVGIYPIAATSRLAFLDPRVVIVASVGEFIGYPVIHEYVYDAAIPWQGIRVLMWMFMLNFGIGLFNLLPAVPLDGGYIFRGLLEKKVSRRIAYRVSYALALFVLAVLIINLSPMLWR